MPKRPVEKDEEEEQIGSALLETTKRISEWSSVYNHAVDAAPEHPDAPGKVPGLRKGYLFNRQFVPYSSRHLLVWTQMLIRAFSLDQGIATFVYSNPALADMCYMGTTDLNKLMYGLQALGLVTRAHRGWKKTVMTFLHFNPLPFNAKRATAPLRQVDSDSAFTPGIQERVDHLTRVLEEVVKEQGLLKLLPRGKKGHALPSALRDCLFQARQRYENMAAADYAFFNALPGLFQEGTIPEEERFRDVLLISPNFCLMLPPLYADILDAWEKNPQTASEWEEMQRVSGDEND